MNNLIECCDEDSSQTAEGIAIRELARRPAKWTCSRWTRSTRSATSFASSRFQRGWSLNRGYGAREAAKLLDAHEELQCRDRITHIETKYNKDKTGYYSTVARFITFEIKTS
jgi:hypothetical protein